jgi:glucose repression mediator protein
MQDFDSAMECYQLALKYNQWSVPAMQGIACILRTKDAFPQAVEYLRTILKVDNNNGDVWGSLGHCYLMMDDLQQAYSAYQQALYHLSDPKVRRTKLQFIFSLLTFAQEPKLWYGIGILYDRYGSLEHAEEAFSQVMRMEPNFEKANEIYFRLGIIYKQQQKFNQSLDVSIGEDVRVSSFDMKPVLQVHCYQPSTPSHRRGHLVPDRSCLRAAEGVRSRQGRIPSRS